MAFITIEDVHGTAEIIAFDSCYSRYSSSIIEENIVYIEGRLSIREDEEPKIVASSIVDFNDSIANQNKRKVEQNSSTNKIKILDINITNLSEEQKDKLRGAIRFFTGEKANIKLQITNNEITKPAGAILLTDKILEKFSDIVGKENVKII